MMISGARESRDRGDPVIQLQVVQGPYVVSDDVRRPVPTGAERLIVLLALRGQIRRKRAAGLLWPDAEPQRRAGNLRSAVWRLRAVPLELVCEAGDALSIRSDVPVDVQVLHETADDAVVDLPGSGGSLSLPFLTAATNLLPGWYDDWLAADRERIRAAALDALDRRSHRLSRSGCWAEAIDTALVAVTCEPLRESSQIALLRAHLAEGNLVEARRAYRAYRAQLGIEVGLAPSAELVRMVTAVG